MSDVAYLGILVGIIAVLALVTAPSLLRKRCRKCNVRNSLDARVCRECGAAFPDDDASGAA